MNVYVELVVFNNLAVDLCISLTTLAIRRKRVSKIRLILTAITGAAVATVFAIAPKWGQILVKVLLAPLMCALLSKCEGDKAKEKICDYLKTEMFRLDHHWFNSFRFSFSTNGINYDSVKVQNFIQKNKSHLSIGITIDGTKQKHDLNRIWKGEDERGSYNDVVRNIPLWLSQFPGAGTKVTISNADIPYICESVLHLFSLGIHEVNINCVFENVWKEGDDKLFEQQLVQLADSIIEGEYYKDYTCSFFNEYFGKPLDKEKYNQNWCGAGKMLSIDAKGNFYPCTRFAQYSLRDKKAWIIGNIYDGINKNRLRPFLTLDRCTQSTQECIDCKVAQGCAWCQGENYDAAETPTIYQRSTAICNMHKARVRANNYYWNKLFRKLELEGIAQENIQKHFKASTADSQCDTLC